MMLDLDHCTCPSFAATWLHIESEHKANLREWIEYLDYRGVEAAHPNDGWVNRDPTNQYFKLAYPHFFNKVGNNLMGSVVALGTYDKYKLVRVIAVRTEVWFEKDHRYYFEYLPDPEMPRMLHLRHVWWPGMKEKVLEWFKR